MLLKAKIQRALNPDGFKLLKESMMELEELSNKKIPPNDLIDYSIVMAKAKCLLFEQMVLHLKPDIARSYLKKCLLTRSGSTKFVNQVLKGLTNIIKKQCLSLDFVDFTLDLVKSANMDITDRKVFDRL